MPSRVLPVEVEAFAFEDIAVAGTAVTLTAATAFPTSGDARGARGAHITVETNSIHYREDGGTPSATVGQLAVAGAEIVLVDSNAIKAFKAIQVSAGATIHVTYYR